VKGSVRTPRTEGGTWSYRLDLGLDDRGRRRQQEVGGFRTKKDAQAALNEALADRQRGTYAPPSRTTVQSFLDEWHQGARTELALTAWTNYGQIIRRNINPYLGSKRLTDLSPIDVKRWHGTLLESGKRDGGGLSVASVKLAHRILRRALADAVRWNVIVTNPAAATRVPKGEPKELAVWSADDARGFLDALCCRDARFEFASTLVAPSGEERTESQLGDSRRREEQLIAAEVFDVRCEPDRTSRIERRAEDAGVDDQPHESRARSNASNSSSVRSSMIN
jgi:hypothetical protein